MTETNVILCATRGGEASHHTQERAIELAKERTAKLVFIFVYDTRFLEQYTAPHVPATATAAVAAAVSNSRRDFGNRSPFSRSRDRRMQARTCEKGLRAGCDL